MFSRYSEYELGIMMLMLSIVLMFDDLKIAIMLIIMYMIFNVSLNILVQDYNLIGVYKKHSDSVDVFRRLYSKLKYRKNASIFFSLWCVVILYAGGDIFIIMTMEIYYALVLYSAVNEMKLMKEHVDIS